MGLNIVPTSILTVTIAVKIFLSYDHPWAVVLGNSILVGEVIEFPCCLRHHDLYQSSR